MCVRSSTCFCSSLVLKRWIQAATVHLIRLMNISLILAKVGTNTLRENSYSMGATVVITHLIMSVIACSIDYADAAKSYKELRNNAKLFSRASISIEARKVPKFEMCCWVFSKFLQRLKKLTSLVTNPSFSFALWMAGTHATTVWQVIKL